MIRKLKTLTKILITGASLLVFSVFILKAPDTHKDIIRSYVGNKTVMLRGDKSGGTGFLVTNSKGNTYIITNKHVCEIAYESNGNKILYAVNNDGTFLPRKVISISKNHDLCALQAPNDRTGLNVASSLSVGQNIAIVGHPKLYPLQISRGEFTGSTIITMLTECSSRRIIAPFIIERADKISNNNMFAICTVNIFSNRITAYSRGGSSGSPVVNFYGDVVGVLFAGHRDDQFDSYMVPLSYLKEFVNEDLK